jgi:hypothetical protein
MIAAQSFFVISRSPPINEQPASIGSGPVEPVDQPHGGAFDYADPCSHVARADARILRQANQHVGPGAGERPIRVIRAHWFAPYDAVERATSYDNHAGISGFASRFFSMYERTQPSSRQSTNSVHQSLGWSSRPRLS